MSRSTRTANRGGLRSFAAHVLGLAVVATLVAAPAEAQLPVSFNIGGGLTVPSGDLADMTDNGYHGMVGVRFSAPALPVHVRVDGIYNNLPASAGDVDLSTIGMLAGLGYDVVPVGPAKLYALAGGGYYWSKVDVAGAERVGDLGWNAGIGFRFNLMAAKAFVEARYHSISTDGGNMTSMPFTVGLTF